MIEISYAALFVAGLIMFLAPCTFPLVPGYLTLIATSDDGKSSQSKIFLNGLAFVVGFSAVFTLFGLLVGLIGAQFGQVRLWLTILSGVFVILFGYSILRTPRSRLLGVLSALVAFFITYNRLGFDLFFTIRNIVLIIVVLVGIFYLSTHKQPLLAGIGGFKFPKKLKRGSPFSSFVMGLAFGTGWTPCAGPALGAAIGLASNSATAFTGAGLLATFSAGLAVPFLLVAAAGAYAQKYVSKFSKYLNSIQIIGAVFFIFLGVLLLMNQAILLTEWSFRFFEIFSLDFIVEYL